MFEPTPGGLAFALELALIIGDASEIDIVANISVMRTVAILRGDSCRWLDMNVGETHGL
ncbi:MAG: hypothetical protein HOL79_05530 [Euryarchaeota archaeon]|nr:hypothetical protein [Euryarchaeota archaeon]